MYPEERLGPRTAAGLWDVEEGEILSIHRLYLLLFSPALAGDASGWCQTCSGVTGHSVE